MRGALLGMVVDSLVELSKLVVVALTELHRHSSEMDWKFMDVLEAFVFVLFPPQVILCLLYFYTAISMLYYTFAKSSLL